MRQTNSRSLTDQLYPIRKKMRSERKVTLQVPAGFSFNRSGLKNFDPVVNFFDWTLSNRQVEIDFSGCSSANYQALALLVPYCWHLKQQGCNVSFKYDESNDQNATHMWSMMGGRNLFSVATDSTVNFKSSNVKPLIAIRNPEDFRAALDKAVEYIANFGTEYQKTVRYMLAELLYNASEHGRRDFSWRNKKLLTPTILNLSWYEQANEIGILVADIGVGIHSHLAQAYPAIGSSSEALRLAVQPEILGTFGKHDPYSNRNNAGMGLFLSSSIVRRLRANMYIVSDDAVLHVSPNDLTTHNLSSRWHGTFVLVTMQLDQSYQFIYDQIMQDSREQARIEIGNRKNTESEQRHYLNIYNYFGKNAEDKAAAISYRDKHLFAAVDSGQIIVIDFDGVSSTTHSFLNALLASPIRRLGMSAYKRIRITRASSDIRETVDYVFDDNTSPEGVENSKYEPLSADQKDLFK